MGDTINTTAELDNLLQTLYVRKALPRLLAKAVLYQFAEKTPLPQGQGKTVRWNAWSNFTPITGALGEGINPQLGALSSRKVEATIAQYSKGVKLSDLVEYTSSLDVANGVVENLGDWAGLSVDKVIQSAIFKNSIVRNQNAFVLSAWFSSVASGFIRGTNTAQSDQTWGFPVVFGASSTRLSNIKSTGQSVSCNMSLYAIRKVVKQLRANNAMEFADGYFKLVTNTDAISKLAEDPAYKQWQQYTTSAPMEAGEAIRPVEGCKIYKSNNLPKHRGSGATRPHSCDLTFVFAQGAYGVTEFGNGGKGFEIIIKRSGPQDTSNPANMYGTMVYKFALAAKALNLSAGRVLITTTNA